MRWLTVVFLLGCCGLAYAGDNQLSQACLSWVAEGLVTERDTAQGPFPVYVQVDGASDIRGLSVCLRWYPQSYVLADPPPSWKPVVGYNINAIPDATFPSDTSFDATIIFPTQPSDHAVIAYWFQYDGKGPLPPATFCLREVKAMDGAGQVDRLALLGGLHLAGGAVPGGCPPTRSSIARGELLVRMRPGALGPTTGRAPVSPQQLVVSQDAADSMSASGVLTMKRISPPPQSVGARSRNLIGEPIVMPDPGAVYAAHLRQNVVVKRVAHQLEALSVIDAARPVPTVHLFHAPQDPLFSGQWALSNTSQTYGCTLPPFNQGTDIHLPAALDMASAAGNGVRIGVLDSGVQSDHPELVGRVESGFNAVADLDGVSWATEDSTSHGTAVAGIIAATSDNGIGMAGIASAATIVPIRQSFGPHYPYMQATHCMADEFLGLAAALNGLWWATASGSTISIINMSWGTYGSESEHPELATACLAGLLKGQFLVAASGNDNSDDPEWVPAPAKYAKRVFSVGAVFGNGLRWDDRVYPQPPGGWGMSSWVSDLPSGSNWGPHLTAVAPGGHMIASLRMYTLVDSLWYVNYIFDCAHKYFPADSCNNGIPNVDSLEFGGTSAAAPAVAGVAALLMGEHPGALVGEDIAQVLIRTAVNPLTGAPSSGRSDTLGAGMIRAELALAFLGAPKIIDHPRDSMLAVAGIDTVQIGFAGGTPGLPDGQYDAVRYRLTGRATFSQTLCASTVATWVRASGTQGVLDAANYDYLGDVPFGRITSIDTLGVDVETFVYKVFTGGNMFAWYPCDTASAAVATTAVGYPAALAGVGSEPAPRFSVTVSPTPSRGRAVLNLLSPGPAIVEAAIFDVQGRVVRRFARRSVLGGTVQFVWDGRRDDGGYAADGVYYARGSANAQAKVVRVVLLR